MIGRALTLLALVLAASACQRPREDPDAYAAGVAVERYVERLPEAFRAARPDLLAEVAGGAELERVSSIVSSLRSRGKHMEARQLEHARLDVRPLPPTAGGAPAFAVSTRERWIYQHLDEGAAGPAPDAAPREASYRMTYTVVREQDRWIVAAAVVERD